MNVTEWINNLKDVLMADQHRLNRLQRLWGKHYHFYHQVLSQVNSVAYAEVCLEHEADAVEAALSAWQLELPQGQQKPRPAMPCEIVATLTNRVQPEQEAAELAARAWGLLSYPGSGDIKEAERRAGPIATACYNALGGLKLLCAQSKEDERGMFIAQFRDLAVPQIVRRNREERMPDRTALPARPAAPALPAAGQAMEPFEVEQALDVPNPASVAMFMRMVVELAQKKALAQHV